MAEKSSLYGEAKKPPPQASEKRRKFDPLQVNFVCYLKYLIRGGGRSPVKLVSWGQNSLLTGKITGNFAFFGRFQQNRAEKPSFSQVVTSKFPKNWNRELILGEQGIVLVE
jgi:hypothetical protein